MQDDRWLVAVTLSTVATAVTGLLVPLYLVRLGAGAAILGLAAAIAALISAPGAVIAGRYADRTDAPRTVVIAGFATAAVAAILLPVLATIPAVITLNAVLTVALAAVAPVITMVVVSGVPEREWDARIARLNTYQGYGGIAGLLLGALWTAALTPLSTPAIAQQTLFGVAALIAVTALVIAYNALPDTRPLGVDPDTADAVVTSIDRTDRRVRDATFGTIGPRVYWATHALRTRRLPPGLSRTLVVYFLGGLLFFVGFGAFWAPLPLYLTDIGFGSGTVFFLYLVNSTASTLCFTAAGRINAAYDPRLLQSSALGLRGVAFLGIGVFAAVGVTTIPTQYTLTVVAALLAAVGVTWAVIAVAGTALVSRLAPNQNRGAILGAYAALSAVGSSIGSLVGGWTASHSFPIAFGVAGALVVAGGVVVLTLARQTEP